MVYDINSQIRSLEDVKAFFEYLANDRNISFHPDDYFAEYINVKTGEPLFSNEEAVLYDRLMDESFEVCEKSNNDIYEIGMKVMLSAANSLD